jgi:hypothetical protein
MVTSALYEPTEFESLIEVPWEPARVEDAIAEIVFDADAAFDQEALWPAHEWDAREQPLPLQSLYAGAAGVIWSLDTLRRRGHAETSLDLVAAASRTLELKRAAPDFARTSITTPHRFSAARRGLCSWPSSSAPILRSRAIFSG